MIYCPLNQGVYRLLGGPGKVTLCGIDIYLIYDYVHIMKNVRNNWITVKPLPLSFKEGGIEYRIPSNKLPGAIINFKPHLGPGEMF